MGYFGWEVKKRMKGVLLKKVSQALFTWNTNFVLSKHNLWNRSLSICVVRNYFLSCTQNSSFVQMSSYVPTLTCPTDFCRLERGFCPKLVEALHKSDTYVFM
jgi:hypothetical protein